MEAPHHRQVMEVAFGDTDASGWMHFPNIFRYVEVAEHGYLRSLGVMVFDRGQGGWPRVKVSCDYKKPLLAGERIEVLLEVSRIGTASITWDFEIVKSNGDLAAHGSMINVRVDHDGKPQQISAGERAKLERGL